MSEPKSITIKIDPSSINILKKVDPLHRESLINLGISLISKTGYYKTLSGENQDLLDSIVDLGELDNTNITTTNHTTFDTKPAIKAPEILKQTKSWDDF